MTLRQLVTNLQRRLQPSAARPIGADFAANRLNLVQADWRRRLAPARRQFPALSHAA